MKTVFRERTGRMGSLLGLTVALGLSVLFVLAAPQMWVSEAGKGFVLAWGLAAVLVGGSHASRLARARRESRRRRAAHVMRAVAADRTAEKHKVRPGPFIRGFNR